MTDESAAKASASLDKAPASLDKAPASLDKEPAGLTGTSTSLDDVLQTRLEQRRAQQLLRRRPLLDAPQAPYTVINGQRYLSFCSNDYLGLAADPRIADAAAQALRQWGVGAGASHLVCGHQRPHHQLEEALADWTGRPRALLFSSGYMANLGVLNALVGRGDHLFQDRLNHASLLDGGLLSGARFQRFRHNDSSDLQRRLQSCEGGQRLVAVDGVFSMDGDLAPLPELAAVCAANRAWLMVDDAHGLGVLGPQGAGSLAHFGLGTEQAPVLMGTLGKALGSCGAFVAGSETLIESLIQFARTYIYTTALPPAVAAASLAAVDIARREDWRREHLYRLIAQLRQGAEQLGIALAPSQSAVQPLLLGRAELALRVSAALAERGLWVAAIRPPTVPAGTARLRITLSAAHTTEQVEQLLAALAEVLAGVPREVSGEVPEEPLDGELPQ